MRSALALAVVRGRSAVLLLAASACGDSAEPGWPPSESTDVVQTGANDLRPPTARWELVEELRASQARPRHPSDGGGRLWLELTEGDDGSVQASDSRSWTLLYEAGPLGLAVGGALVFQAPAFWGWSPPQVEAESAPGFTRLSCEAEGVTLRVRRIDTWLVAAWIEGRALAAGERVRIEYGAGLAGARADRFAESASPFRCEVDGDGDGSRQAVLDSPTVAVRAGPPAQLVLSLQSAARPGEELRLTLAVLDRFGNAGCLVEGTVELSLPPELAGPATLTLRRDDGGLVQLTLRAMSSGLHRISALGPGGLQAVSNPCHVSEDSRPLLWGDLHGHSALSDGTGTPEAFYRYARDVAALDVAALTDHDHWGQPFLDETPSLWAGIEAATASFHDPGRFVTLLGYEWTSWIHGHRHVLYFEDSGRVLSSLDERYETPAQLWEALAGQPALTFAHHVAGGPIATNWSFVPDPVLEPLVELSSVHGSSEAADSPALIEQAVPGHFARDALLRGYRLGFLGSGDSHDGHPGLAHLAAPRGHGGLAAILAEESTRAAVLAALRARRCYATNGARIVLRAALAGLPMGSVVPPGAQELRVLVAGTAPLERIDLVRGREVVESRAGRDRLDAAEDFALAGLLPGEFVYVRVVQADGGLAWSSPFFVESAP
ncbi:MAG: CehA/McbA family metallohydrolase [Planctomycetota bacterium]